MMTKTDDLRVTVVGGAGHVGAPLAIVLASRGVPTVIHDINEGAMAELAAGRLPFRERDGEQLLRYALERNTLTFSSDPACVADSNVVVVTIGTPIDEFHNPKLSVLTSCMDRLLPYLGSDKTLLLRSTVAPGVTAFLDRYLSDKGCGMGIAFCPERVVQGEAIHEVRTLPQIVSGTTERALEVATRLFSRVAPSVVVMTTAEAELAKLLCNAYRYIQFAATNEFYMLAESLGIDYQRLLQKSTEGYPRMAGIPGPGFAAGPCLMKDTMQLAASAGQGFLLGHAAMSVNEGLPLFIVEQLRKRITLSGSTVGILGMAFKAESDDIRDSLSYKLRKLLTFHGATVLCSDEYVCDPALVSVERLLELSDAVVVAVPHARYRGLRVESRTPVIDPWRVVVQ